MFKDFAIYGIDPSNGNPLTDPALGYVRNGAEATSGGVGNAWTRPYTTFVPDRDSKYFGVGARIASMNLSTIGQEHLNAQYFTKWQLERAQSDGTPRAFTPAREVQIIVKADAINHITNPAPTSTTGYGFVAGTTTMDTGWIKQVYTGAQTAQLAPPHTEMPVKPGEDVYVSFRYRGPGGGVAIIHWRDINDNIVAQPQKVLPNTGTEEALVEMAVKVPDNPLITHAWLAQLIYTGTPIAAGTHYFRDILFKKGLPHPFFSGDSGDDYLWEGTANASRSYYYENRLDRVEAIRRALRDAVPLGIGVAEPKFAVWTE